MNRVKKCHTGNKMKVNRLVLETQSRDDHQMNQHSSVHSTVVEVFRKDLMKMETHKKAFTIRRDFRITEHQPVNVQVFEVFASGLMKKMLE